MHPSMPRLLNNNNTIKEFIDGDSRFFEHDEEQQHKKTKKKWELEYRIWTKKKKNKQ